MHGCVRTVAYYCALSALVLVAAARAEAADIVTLTSGLQIEGDITVENEAVVKVRVDGRVMQFPRKTIANIEYGPDSTAPSQQEQRETESEEELKQAQERVQTIKVRHRPKKKEKEEEEEAEEAQAGPVGVLNPDGTLYVPPSPTEAEAKWIEELRTGKNKIQACRELAQLKSVYALPALIRALDDESVYVRREAHEALQSIAQQDFGFRPDARRRSDRIEPIKQWQKWYEKASGKRVPW